MPDRIKPLEGVQNFRDFGGYDAKGGRVRREKLFRTAHLATATDADVAFLDGLGVDFQVDLRRGSERKSQPNLWAPPIVHADEGDADALAAHVAFLLKAEVTPQSARAFMLSFYEDVPFDAALKGLYGRWFEGLDLHDGAGLVNCAAGKDRTGLACALTLSLLEVDHDAVVSDYEKTNIAVDLDGAVSSTAEKLKFATGRDIEHEALRNMFCVHADYLDAALDAINARCGSIRQYAADHLGVDDARLARLRAKLIE